MESLQPDDPLAARQRQPPPALPDDVLACVFATLPSTALRACATTSKAWARAIRRAPEPIRRRARWAPRTAVV
eukprot:COSAG01_NODE_193_length_22433_cov_91.669114_21_plen_73_part_00